MERLQRIFSRLGWVDNSRITISTGDLKERLVLMEQREVLERSGEGTLCGAVEIIKGTPSTGILRTHK